ncbi:MAG: PAS domain S-box protein, partial [Planctomycetota bacterium]
MKSEQPGSGTEASWSDHFHEILHHLPSAAFVCGADDPDVPDRILTVNQSACRLYGWTAEELVGKPLDFLDANEEETALEMEPGGLPGIIETTHRRKGGSTFPVEIAFTEFVLDGRVLHLVTCAEASERRKAEQDLARERELFEALLAHIPDSIYFKDRQNRFVRVSKSKADHLGVEVEGILGKTDADFYPPEEAERMAADDLKVMETGEPVVDKEEKITRPDGEVRWVSATKVPRCDQEGRITGTIGISRDVTERRRAEMALSESEERFRLLGETSSDGINIVRWDPEAGTRRLIYCNDRYVEMSGYTREELEGADDLNKLTDPHLSEEERQQWSEHMLKGLPFSGVSSWKRPDA